MKITFNAKIVANLKIEEPTLDYLANVLASGRYTVEYVRSWGSSYEPTLIIAEKE